MAEEKKVKIVWDESKCVRCGLCASLVPEVFEMKEGKIIIHEDKVAEKLDAVRDAVKKCPANALKLEE